MDNQSLPYEDSDLEHHSITLSVIYSIICVAGLLGNMLVIVVFAFYEKKKTLTYAFFLNLAVADILFLCTLPFLAYQLLYKWIFGDIMCKIVFGMYRVNLYTSMLTLTAISFDRFVSIVKVVKVQKYQQHKHRWGGIMCVLIWMTALLLAVPQFKFSVNETDLCMESFELSLKKIIYSVQLVVGFFLPLSAIVFCYSFILNTLIRSRSLQKKKSIRIILTLVVVFIVTQLPFNVILLIFLNQDTEISDVLIDSLSILEAVAYLHACLNPFLYFFVGSKFRNSFWKMMREFRMGKGWNEPSRETEGSSKAFSASTKMEDFSIVQT
ncbi:C-X-C chemokine receptor type 6-like isoform X2 [Pyxicephalus adspersus]|uniref:G-protein coupled receptors family 1 profile domain-containing protein n=2 Tax=Pyxicephalus adspersus TaxID=30357 RepID=A0AAV2ZQC4_PYXAD|nr:TPA: hypothetical protein GDO54_004029 [Pyxicephalus adspersus]